MMDQGKGLEQARRLMEQYWAATLAFASAGGIGGGPWLPDCDPSPVGPARPLASPDP